MGISNLIELLLAMLSHFLAGKIKILWCFLNDVIVDKSILKELHHSKLCNRPASKAFEWSICFLLIQCPIVLIL